MNRNTQLLNLLLVSLLLPVFSNAQAMETAHHTQEPTDLIAAQVVRIKQYVAAIREPKLALGVQVNESERFDKSYVFLGNWGQTDDHPRALTVNFNSLQELEFLAKHLRGVFQLVVLDDSTYKFTKWGTAHIQCFRDLLVDGGRFIFGPFIASTSIKFEESTYEETLEKLRANKIHGNDSLVVGFDVPFFIQTAENQFAEQIATNFGIRKAFKSSPISEWDNLVDKFGISWFPSEHLLEQSDEEILDQVTGECVRGELVRQFFREEAIPNNIMKIVGNVFGSSNVVLAENAPLPFKSNYNETQQYLITATEVSSLRTTL